MSRTSSTSGEIGEHGVEVEQRGDDTTSSTAAEATIAGALFVVASMRSGRAARASPRASCRGRSRAPGRTRPRRRARARRRAARGRRRAAGDEHAPSRRRAPCDRRGRAQHVHDHGVWRAHMGRRERRRRSGAQPPPSTFPAATPRAHARGVARGHLLERHRFESRPCPAMPSSRIRCMQMSFCPARAALLGPRGSQSPGLLPKCSRTRR